VLAEECLASTLVKLLFLFLDLPDIAPGMDGTSVSGPESAGPGPGVGAPRHIYYRDWCNWATVVFFLRVMTVILFVKCKYCQSCCTV